MVLRRLVDSWELVSLALAIVCLIVSTAWFLGDQPAPFLTVIPGCSDSQAATLGTNPPAPIAWETCLVNDDNPFVPWHQRHDSTTTQVPPAPPAQPVDPGPAPVLNLPPRAVGGGAAPRIHGIHIQQAGIVTALVRMPEDTNGRWAKPGDRFGDWTFVGIEAGNIATFTDRDGRVLSQVVGEAHTSLAQEGAPSAP